MTHDDQHHTVNVGDAGGSIASAEMTVSPTAVARAALRADAGQLPIGSRVHGELVGTLLGSVSAHCVDHARGPVVVVRDNPDGG